MCWSGNVRVRPGARRRPTTTRIPPQTIPPTRRAHQPCPQPPVWTTDNGALSLSIRELDWSEDVSEEKPAECSGMICFLGAELTREAIFRAMDQRRTYAASGVPTVCHLEVNGALMGSGMALPRDSKVRSCPGSTT